MKCIEYEERVSALIDNELADQESELLFAHLGECVACRATLRSELQLRANLKEDVPPLAPKELDEKVLSTMSRAGEQLGARVMRKAAWRRNVSMPWPLAAAIAGLFLIGGLAVTSVWFPFAKPPAEPQVRIVYVTTLPTVEVQGYFP